MGYADYYEQMPKIFRLSDVNLNISLRTIQTGIPLRVLDVLACGGFLISNYQEELAESIGELTEQTLQLDGVKTDIQEEIKDIVNKMKLLEEDIKGAVVDTTV